MEMVIIIKWLGYKVEEIVSSFAKRIVNIKFACYSVV